MTLTCVVAGAGSIGRRHVGNLRELGVDVLVSDPDAEARDRVAATDDVETFPSLAEVFASASPDAVVIATPNSHHVDVATAAAEAGCHLFVEKPLSHDLAGVDDLEAIVAERDLVSLVGCNFRFHPAIRKVRELLAEGAIGNVVAARIEAGSYLPEWFPDGDYREAYSAREDLGGGVVLDYIHEINYARWFFGEFETVSAMTGQRTALEIETNDVAAIIAETTDDVICEFHLDYTQRAYSRSCHVVGEEGTVRWSWDDERVEWYREATGEWETFHRPDEWETNDMYRDEMEHFLECVRTGESTICPIDCGRRDLAVTLAARESAATGRHVGLED